MDRQTFLWFLHAQQCEYHRRLFQARALNYLTKNNFLNKAIPYPGGVKSHFWWIPIFIKTEKKSYEVSRDGIHAAGAIAWAPPSSWKREQHLLEEPNHLLVVTKMHLRRVTWPPPGQVSSLWIMHSPDNVSRFFFFLQKLEEITAAFSVTQRTARPVVLFPWFLSWWTVHPHVALQPAQPRVPGFCFLLWFLPHTVPPLFHFTGLQQTPTRYHKKLSTVKICS